jgi:hypothetical protein
MKGLASLIAPDDPKLAKMLTAVKDSGTSMQQLKDLDIRACIVQKLAIAIEKLVTVERKLYGLDKGTGGQGIDYDTLLDELHRIQGRLVS